MAVRVGSPAQEITVIFDTGSDELWVNPSCDNSDSEIAIDACHENGHYFPNRSSTANDLDEAFSIIYGSGSAYGEYFTDNVRVGGKSISSASVVDVAPPCVW